jgi:phage regulator Rha-like protein
MCLCGAGALARVPARRYAVPARGMYLRSQIAISKLNATQNLRSQIVISRRSYTPLSSMPKRPAQLAVPVESRILILRRQRVILDSDLAELYDVTVKRLNEQIRRNRERFPADFMFLLTAEEHKSLRSQIATSKKGRGGRRYPPYAFTEHGAIMAATVLNSKRAIEMSVFVVRAFVRMREMLAKNRQLAAKIDELDRRLETHDSAIQDLIEAIKELMIPEAVPRRKIGFLPPPAKS